MVLMILLKGNARSLPGWREFAYLSVTCGLQTVANGVQAIEQQGLGAASLEKSVEPVYMTLH